MGWSWKLGRMFGIDVYVHVTFAVFLGWVALSTYLRTRESAEMVVGVLSMLAVFGSVVLHELGHALTARRFGIKTRDITLLPIGGVARMERMPEKPWQEFLVALAGPAVNVVIAAVLLVGLTVAGATLVPDLANARGMGSFFPRLLWVNVGLAIFNLVPAFPMDGGRALRALLALRGDYVAATQLAAQLGQGIALLFGVLGVLYNPILVFIALFVWIGAASEAAGVRMKAALHGIPTRTAMQTEFHILSADDTLGDAVRTLLAGSQVDFPVVGHDGQVLGVLTRAGLIKGLAEKGTGHRVSEVMDRRFVIAHPYEMLDVALARLEDRECRSLPVVADGRVVGMLTPDNVSELMMVRSALKTPPSRAEV